MKKKISFLVIANIILNISALAQPYKYAFDFSSHPYSKIYRVELMTGRIDTIIRHAEQYESFLLNPSQTRLILAHKQTGEYDVVNPEIPDSVLKKFNVYRGMIGGVLDAPNNLLYISGGFGASEDDTVGKAGSLLVDRNSLAVLDTIPWTEINLRIDGYSKHNRLRSFFSGDKSLFFTFVRDNKLGLYFDVASTTTNRHTGRKQCGTLGGFIYGPSLVDARNGYAVISYETSAGFAYKRYVVCNVDAGTIESIIPFTKRANVYLSADARYTIIEEANWDNSLESKVFKPGNIYIYESQSGRFVQHLSLPPQGEMLLFDNYSNMLYYYLPSNQRSINIDLSKLTSVTSLNPAFAYAGSNALTLTINGKNFVSGSTVNWNGLAKATSFIADSILQASILSSDIAVIDSPLVTVKNSDGGESNSIRFYIKQQPIISGCNVKLINSTGTKLIGGTLQYYDGSWKDAVNNNDGTFFVNTTKTTLSLRMTYEYGTQTKSNVTVGYDTVAFQTVNTQMQLQNSSGAFIDTGTVQYYAGAWRTLGTTISGIASKELLPANYSFRMTYAYASKDKQQDIGTNSIVVFQTVNAAVQLQNSQGNLIDQGTVQYYSGAWRSFGTTSNGVANKELLPNNYSFRMTYEYASKDKQQDLSVNPTVVFQTVNAAVQLQNSQGALIDQGSVQYYSGAWRSLGTTSNGIATKELLPNNYSFRMTYEYASKDKQQDLSTNPIVVFQTVNAAVQLQNSLGALIDQGTVQYYSGAWRTFGTTNNGTTNKELLPNNYSFRMTYEYASKDKQQDLSTNPTVVFQTVIAQVQLKNSLGNLIDQGTVQYYSGAWRSFGITTNGTASKELLPSNYSFRMTYEYVSIDKQQDLSANSTVSFSTVLCTIRVRNSQDQLVDNAFASYYSGAWRQIGKTVNGEITKELLPLNLSFRIKYDTQQLDKQQNLSTNNVVEFGIQ